MRTVPRKTVERPLGAAGVDVGALRDDRVRRGREVLARRHEEAVVVALGLVDDDERAAARQQPERDDPDDDADDDQHDPPGRPTACAGTGSSERSATRRRALATSPLPPRLPGRGGTAGTRPVISSDVRGDPGHPAVEPEHEVEDSARIPGREEQARRRRRGREPRSAPSGSRSPTPGRTRARQRSSRRRGGCRRRCSAGSRAATTSRARGRATAAPG